MYFLQLEVESLLKENTVTVSTVIGSSTLQLLMTNDSFSSQTWAILYLNETLIKSQYRTQPNDSPVRCQNQEYFQTHMNLP